jgi:hypothetical protein
MFASLSTSIVPHILAATAHVFFPLQENDMTIEITVGPPIITISQGRIFMVTDKSGYIAADSDQASTRSIHASLVSISSTSTVSPGT